MAYKGEDDTDAWLETLPGRETDASPAFAPLTPMKGSDDGGMSKETVHYFTQQCMGESPSKSCIIMKTALIKAFGCKRKAWGRFMHMVD